MARSVWEDATPEARAGLRNINQHVGETPGKRTGPGSPGYLSPRNLAPERQASIGRRLEAKTKMDIARMNMDVASEDRKSLANLQDAKFAQEDKTFERNLETGVFGRRSSGSRRAGGLGGNGTADDDWKYGGKSALTEAPTYRTNSSGMQLYTPESVDKKTGMVTPGEFGKTLGGAPMSDVPTVPKEGTGTVMGRPGGLQYSQNIYQRKDKRADGSDRFTFTNIGSPNAARGDRNIANDSGNYDREMMNLPWREGTEDKNIAKAAAIEKAGAIAKNNALENTSDDLASPSPKETLSKTDGYLPDEPGLAHVEGQFEDAPIYKGSVAFGKGLKNLAKDFVAQYEPPKRPNVIPQLGEPGRPAPIDPRLRRKSTFLENKQFEDISNQIKDRYKLINGKWVDTQAVK